VGLKALGGAEHDSVLVVANGMLFPTTDCSLSVTLALRLHILQGQPAAEGLPQIFDERFARLSDNENSTVADVQTIFGLLWQLMVALGARREADVLVHTLVLVERLVGQSMDCLCRYTWRPIVLTAFILSVKKYFDETTVGIVHNLNAIGITGLSRCLLFRYETSFLDCIDWNVEVSRPTYTNYIFALRDLVSRQAAALRKQCPGLVSFAYQLGEPDTVVDPELSAAPQPAACDDTSNYRARLASRTPPSVPTWQLKRSGDLATLYALFTPRSRRVPGQRSSG